jgi:hypothetical protein
LVAEVASQAWRRSGEHWAALVSPAYPPVRLYNIVSKPYSGCVGEIGEMSAPRGLPLVDIGAF